MQIVETVERVITEEKPLTERHDNSVFYVLVSSFGNIQAICTSAYTANKIKHALNLMPTSNYVSLMEVTRDQIKL